MNPTVWVIDDEEVFRTRLVQALLDRGFEAKGYPTGQAAIQQAKHETPECAIVDLRMPGLSGLQVVKKLHSMDATTRIVVLTGYGSIASAVDAVRSGAIQYFTKPTDIDEIILALGRNTFFEKEPSTASAPPAVPSLARVEWEHIDRVLTQCDGNISQAATLLGLHRRSLQRKLAKRPVSR